MFEEKAKQMVKDILTSVDLEGDPIRILMEVYIENKLKEAYNEGYDNGYDDKV